MDSTDSENSLKSLYKFTVVINHRLRLPTEFSRRLSYSLRKDEPSSFTIPSASTINTTTTRKNKISPKLASASAKVSQISDNNYYPIFTVGTSIPYLTFLIVIYTIIGILINIQNNQVVEYRFEYTNCDNHATNGGVCNWTQSLLTNRPCKCIKRFQLEKFINKSVYIYYELENMYQTYHHYTNSLDMQQFLGFNIKIEDFDQCDPESDRFDSMCRVIVRFGLLANSLFNDSFELSWLQNQTITLSVPIIFTDITWQPLYSRRNPPITEQCLMEQDPLQCSFNNTTPPSNWIRPIWKLDPKNSKNNGFLNTHLSSWIRVSAFSTFRKLYGKVDHSSNEVFNDMLPSGKYELRIINNYPIASFGRKFIIISNTSMFGGRNYFLAYLYVIIALVLLIILFGFHYIDRKFGQLSYDVYSYLRKRSENEKSKRQKKLK